MEPGVKGEGLRQARWRRVGRCAAQVVRVALGGGAAISQGPATDLARIGDKDLDGVAGVVDSPGFRRGYRRCGDGETDGPGRRDAVAGHCGCIGDAVGQVGGANGVVAGVCGENDVVVWSAATVERKIEQVALGVDTGADCAVGCEASGGGVCPGLFVEVGGGGAELSARELAVELWARPLLEQRRDPVLD